MGREQEGCEFIFSFFSSFLFFFLSFFLVAALLTYMFQVYNLVICQVYTMFVTSALRPFLDGGWEQTRSSSIIKLWSWPFQFSGPPFMANHLYPAQHRPDLLLLDHDLNFLSLPQNIYIYDSWVVFSIYFYFCSRTFFFCCSHFHVSQLYI